MKKSIIENTKQLFLIVFSVVFGLYLSERIEEQKDEKEAMKLLSKVTSEVNDNQKLLEHWAPYHREITERLDSLCNNETFIENFINDKSILFNEVLTRGTFMSRMPSSDAWDIAKSHPLVVNIDYEELLILSKIYNQQKSTYEPVAKIFEKFFTSDVNTKENAKPNLLEFQSQIQEIVGREVQLMNYFIEAEQILKFQNK